MSDDSLSPSSSETPNVFDGLGITDKGRKELWPSTKQAIKDAGLELGNPLSHGATCVVFEGVDRWLKRSLVIKVIVDPSRSENLAYFKRESQLLISEEMPLGLAPRLFHTSKDQDSQPGATRIQPFLAMEHIRGKKIHKYVLDEPKMSMFDRVTLLERFFRQLHRMHHAGLTHGDLSPNNVLVEPGDRIWLIDWGQSSSQNKADLSKSVSGPGGTPDYAPPVQIEGKERSKVWIDIHAGSAIAFHVLTGKSPGPEYSNDRSRFNALEEAGVSHAVGKTIVKGMRNKNPRKPARQDSRLFGSAKEIADRLAAHQRRGRLLKTWLCAAAVFLVMLLPVAYVAYVNWENYRNELRNSETRVLDDLRDQTKALTHPNHAVVEAKLRDAEDAYRQRQQALTRNDTNQANLLYDASRKAFREAIEVANGLIRCQPLMRSMGNMLTLTPWVESSSKMVQVKARLTQKYTELQNLLNQGKPDQAWPQLVQLLADHAEQVQQNSLALKANDGRQQFDQLEHSVSDRLQKLAEFRPFHDLGEKGKQAWNDGDWSLAEKLYGQARQSLDTWLNAQETPGEKALRQQVSAEALVKVEKEKANLRVELDQLLAKRKELESQIATFVQQNIEDRKQLQEANDLKAKAETLLAKKQTEFQTTLDQKQTEHQASLAEMQTTLNNVNKNLRSVNAKLQEETRASQLAKAEAAALQKQLDDVLKPNAEVKLEEARFSNQVKVLIANVRQVDVKDRPKTLLAFRDTVKRYKEVEAERTAKLGRYQETSSIIRADDAKLASLSKVVVEAHNRLDLADKASYEQIQQEITKLNSHYQTMIQDLRPTEPEPKALMAKIQELRGQLAAFQPGYDRAANPAKQTMDFAAILNTVQVEITAGLGAKTFISSASGIKLLLVQSGEYTRGSNNGGGDEKPPHKVKINGLYMAETETTLGQWRKIMPANTGSGETNDHPVVTVSWLDCAKFCNELSKKENLPAFYDLTDENNVRIPDRNGKGYRLPTEAEWEYACRAGTTTEYPFGPDDKQLGDYAWFRDNSGNKTHAVRQKKPNAWGFYDMLGNTWEWCEDWYNEAEYSKYADGKVATNPVSPTIGTSRLLRGGAFLNYAVYARPADRYVSRPTDRNDNCGFRVARALP